MSHDRYTHFHERDDDYYQSKHTAGYNQYPRIDNDEF